MPEDLKYFHQLVDQMALVGVKSIDNVQIIADDAQPAMVIVKRNNEVLVFVQDAAYESLHRL